MGLGRDLGYYGVFSDDEYLILGTLPAVVTEDAH
jgi:hypothetical protein